MISNARSRPSAVKIRRPSRPRRFTAFTKGKVLVMLTMTILAFGVTTWHEHKRPSVQTMHAVTVEGSASQLPTITSASASATVITAPASAASSEQIPTDAPAAQ